MAKETMIVFVYDTEYCKDEADDPVKAVLYFHPSWASDVQKLSLCGQLMGTTYFLNSCFSKPNIISLQNGKFVLKEFGRFTLAVGTDRNISDSLLKHRAELLTSLLKFYHRDIQTIYQQFSANGQYKNLTEKLYHIFETYLPILQYHGNIFQNVPKLRLPKSSSNIFLDAIQTLQSCQQNKGVLGGILLFHNKVVATQLSEGTTKNLVFTDPYRIKSTAEPIFVDFHIPNGVQIMVTYIPISEYKKLQADSQRAQNLIIQNLTGPNNFPFQYQKRKIKRDKSLIFTNIPEEDSSTEHGNILSETNKKYNSPAKNNRIKTGTLQRPTHLPLRFKNVTTKDIPDSISSINFNETDSFPEYIGRTSVCSTPLAENKIVFGSNLVSICANPTEQIVIKKKKEKSNENELKSGDQTPRSFKMDFENFIQHFISNPNKNERRSSLTDMQVSLKKISKNMSVRTYGFGLSKIDSNKNEDNGNNVTGNRHFTSKTISDPMYPVFNSDGGPISKSLFQEFLERYYSSWQDSKKDQKKISQLIEEFKEFDKDVQKLDAKLKQDEIIINKLDEKIESSFNPDKLQKLKTPMDRKLLSLPLKPLNDSIDNASSSTAIFEGGRKKISGIQLTPLMTKLSILALSEERQLGFGNWDCITPGYECATPLDGNKLLRKKSIKSEEFFDANNKEIYQKVELLVCGQQNMTLVLFLEEESTNNREFIQKMFDFCLSKLTRLESQLTQTLNVKADADKSEGGYSFIAIDPKWDTLQRNGPWTQNDINILEHIHTDLNKKKSITEILMRPDENVIYSYKCGRTEIFYKQPANSQFTGLPPPADTMGTISMKAKRRLERDHSFFLF